MTTLKRLFCIFITICMVFNLCALPAAAADNAAATNCINALKKSEAFESGRSYGNDGCWVFARSFCRAMFGDGIRFPGGTDGKFYLKRATGSDFAAVGGTLAAEYGNFSRDSLLSLLKQAYPGDIIQYAATYHVARNSMHTLVIEWVSDDGISVIEHNNSSGVKYTYFSWDTFCNKFNFSQNGQGITLYHYKYYDDLFGSETGTVQDEAPWVSISGETYPDANHKQGAYCEIKGVVRSNDPLNAVKAEVWSTSGALMFSKTVYPNAKSYDLGGVNSAMTFAKLNAGSYVYKVTAIDAAGTSWNLLSKGFQVGAGEAAATPEQSTLSLSGATYPDATHAKGEYCPIKGTIASNYKITSVTAGVWTAGGTQMFSKTVSPNAASYDLSGVNAAMTFAKLDAGNYVYRVDATDASGKTLNLMFREFQVVSDAPAVAPPSGSTITISGATYPSATHSKGNYCPIKGVVSSDYALKSVSAWVESTSGPLMFYYQCIPSSTRFDLSEANDAMTFAKLDYGDYIYYVEAKDASGSLVTLVEVYFSVV